MKVIKTIIIFLCLLPGSLLPAQSQGVDFQHISFDEAIIRAKATNKMIFMDCYTSWCGPCKYMAEQVFTLAKAGEYFNSRYINIKIDMEKGEGKALAERFAVQAFPTFLLIDTMGIVKARVEGSGKLDEFIVRLEQAQDEKSSVAYWERLGQTKKLDRKERMEYLKVLAEARQWEKAQLVANEILAGLSRRQKTSPDYWMIFNNQSLSPFQSPNFLYLVSHKLDFEKGLGKQTVDQKLYSMYNRWVMGLISGVILGRHDYSQSQMDSVRQQLIIFAPTQKHELEVKCRLAELRNKGLCKEMITLLQHEMTCIPQKDLWDVATSFIKFGKNQDADYYNQLLELGVQFENRAESTELKGYMHNFFGHYARIKEK